MHHIENLALGVGIVVFSTVTPFFWSERSERPKDRCA
jgi:hypothetical protein